MIMSLSVRLGMATVLPSSSARCVRSVATSTTSPRYDCTPDTRLMVSPTRKGRSMYC